MCSRVDGGGENARDGFLYEFSGIRISLIRDTAIPDCVIGVLD
jgi:hypothetical protein